MTIGTEPTAEPTTGNRARVKRYRLQHRRGDYAPSREALVVIDLWLDRRLDNCLAGTIDRLVVAGAKAMSGDGGRG